MAMAICTIVSTSFSSCEFVETKCDVLSHKLSHCATTEKESSSAQSRMHECMQTRTQTCTHTHIHTHCLSLSLTHSITYLEDYYVREMKL